MADLPTDTVTLLFTDIAANTQLLHRLGEGYDAVLAARSSPRCAAFQLHGGEEVDTQGDAFFYAFARATDAVAAQAQPALAVYPWPEGEQVRVQMGLRTGQPRRTADGYVGPDLHRGYG